MEDTISDFDASLRGYNRNQVDEYLAKLQRVMSRIEADLRVARADAARHHDRSAAEPARPAPHDDGARPDGPLTDRMNGILRAAREEAAEIRRTAHEMARAARDRATSEIAELTWQRDVVLSELIAMRRQIEDMLPHAPAEQGAGPRPGQPTLVPRAHRPEPEQTTAIARPRDDHRRSVDPTRLPVSDG